MKRRYLWAFAVAVACVAVVELPTAGAATGSTLGYRIFNYSGETFRLAEIRGEQSSTPPVFDQSATAPVPPKVGDELRPGDTLHVELQDQTGNGARLLWRRAGNQSSQIDVSIHLNGDERNSNGSHFSQCSTTSSYACADQTEFIVVLDHPGAVRTLGAAHPEQQAQVLSVFCRGTPIAKALARLVGFPDVQSCGFGAVRNDDNALSPARPVGHAIVNCGLPTRSVTTWPISERVALSSSVGIESAPGADRDYVIGQASGSFPPGWVSQHTFTGELRRAFQLKDTAYPVGEFPIVRSTGTFAVAFANTTWNLNDVSFDTPSVGAREPRYSVLNRDRTPEEVQDCSGVGSRHLLSEPKSRLSVKRRGTHRADTLMGGSERDTLLGLGGNDILIGDGGDDLLDGGAGNDELLGGRGRDTLNGGPGADTIIDTSGRSFVRTGSNSGPLDDYVYVRDGRGDDTVLCGSRRTIVVADSRDRVKGRCGRIIRRGPLGKPTL